MRFLYPIFVLFLLSLGVVYTNEVIGLEICWEVNTTATKSCTKLPANESCTTFQQSVCEALTFRKVMPAWPDGYVESDEGRVTTESTPCYFEAPCIWDGEKCINPPEPPPHPGLNNGWHYDLKTVVDPPGPGDPGCINNPPLAL